MKSKQNKNSGADWSVLNLRGNTIKTKRIQRIFVTETQLFENKVHSKKKIFDKEPYQHMMTDSLFCFSSFLD